jgi:sigma-E factor negative regulatory protein RseC
MEKMGFVVALEDHKALVNVIRPSECGDKCSGCAGACEIKTMIVKVENTYQAVIGDRVELQLAPTQFVKLTFLLYTVPLIAFVLGVFIGYSQYEVIGISNADVTGLVLGFLMMLMTYFIINKVVSSSKKGDALTMTSVIRKNDVITD